MSRYSSVGVLPRTGLALHDVPPYPIQYLSIGAALPCSALSLLVGVTAQAPPVGAPLRFVDEGGGKGRFSGEGGTHLVGKGLASWWSPTLGLGRAN